MAGAEGGVGEASAGLQRRATAGGDINSRPLKEVRTGRCRRTILPAVMLVRQLRLAQKEQQQAHEDTDEDEDEEDPSSTDVISRDKLILRPLLDKDNNERLDDTHEFGLGDCLDYIRTGMEAIVDDEVTKRFSAEELTSWNFLTRTNCQYEFISVRLTIFWVVGFILRYFLLLPLRILILIIGVVQMVVLTLILGLLPEGSVKPMPIPPPDAPFGATLEQEPPYWVGSIANYTCPDGKMSPRGDTYFSIVANETAWSVLDPEFGCYNGLHKALSMLAISTNIIRIKCYTSFREQSASRPVTADMGGWVVAALFCLVAVTRGNKYSSRGPWKSM
ncbi:uncharacterized protein LOC134770992 [Penaeus indicus]|uniref:uncharacterized protein LOC134770992 n=1 Tax=Penaeus indicus TaxID=29960 RepID=UPI00300D3C09